MVTRLLQNTDEFDKMDMQSATIMLGLTSTILSYIGPTVGRDSFDLEPPARPRSLSHAGRPGCLCNSTIRFRQSRGEPQEGRWEFCLAQANSIQGCCNDYRAVYPTVLGRYNSLLNSVQ